MSQVQTRGKDVEENYWADLFNPVLAKGYLTKLFGNDAVKSYITHHQVERQMAKSKSRPGGRSRCNRG